MLKTVLATLIATQAGFSPATFREGMWEMNLERSEVDNRNRQILWVVRSDVEDFAFVLAEVTLEGPPRIVTWVGKYDGKLRPVLGAPIEFSIRRDGSAILIAGTSGAIRFEEQCHQSDNGMRLRCVGQRVGPDGPVGSYVEDYDWKAENLAAAD